MSHKAPFAPKAITTVLLILLTFQNSMAQLDKDTTASLIRFKKGNRSSFRIPLTQFCFVSGAALNSESPDGWILEWDIVENANTNLLFMEMNSTDVEGWLGNEDISGSVQLVLGFSLGNRSQ